MEGSEIIEESISSIQAFLSDFNDENDHYDETEDDYDESEEDNYDDGIANSNHDEFDDGFDDDYSEENDSEAVQPKEPGHLLKKELEDSLQESKDYDELED